MIRVLSWRLRSDAKYVGYVVGVSRYRYRIFELISTISAVPGVVEERLGYLSATLHPSRSPVRLP